MRAAGPWRGRREATLRDLLRLYVVLDRDLSLGRDLVEVTRAALAGGARCVQVRGKEWTGRELYELTAALRPITAAHGALLIVNDRIDIALAAEADGAHIGQADIPAAAARQLLGPDRILGLSVATVGEALEHSSLVDYLSVSPVFATPTKPDAGPGVGLAGLRAIVTAGAPVPAIGIGGINLANAAACIATGAAGVAVVSAVVSAPDVEAAARALLAATIDPAGARG
jgi:thiamine-phosphate diphosphorylase